ncbi:hypothetical protein ACFFOP_16790 [Sinosporangium siamense]|uniref:hypothetical protein n=1 Tax=Sinosporangium siamense TaxID=1367973 RepID=UPI0035E701FC
MAQLPDGVTAVWAASGSGRGSVPSTAARCRPRSCRCRCTSSTGSPTPSGWRRSRAVLESSLAALAGARPESSDGALAVRGLAAAVRPARHGAWKLGAAAGLAVPGEDDLRADLTEAVEEYRSCWPARSRPGGMQRGFAALDAAVAAYQRS